MEDKAICQEHCASSQTVAHVKNKLIKTEEIDSLARIFSILGDQTRIAILDALTVQELCVCDLSEIINKSISAVSHQLRLLKGARLVKSRRQGRNIFYSLDDHHVTAIWQQTLEHIRHI